MLEVRLVSLVYMSLRSTAAASLPDNYVNSCVEVTKKVKRCDFLPQFFPGTRPDSSLDYVTSVFFHILSNSLVCSSSYHIHNMQYELRRAPFNEA